MVQKKINGKKVRVGKLKAKEENVKDLTNKEAQKIKGGRSQSDAQKTTTQNLKV